MWRREGEAGGDGDEGGVYGEGGEYPLPLPSSSAEQPSLRFSRREVLTLSVLSTSPSLVPVPMVLTGVLGFCVLVGPGGGAGGKEEEKPTELSSAKEERWESEVPSLKRRYFLGPEGGMWNKLQERVPRIA